ncbi:MAG: YicC/YloC family endoribonuclease [Polynucleobacter sp.]|uniref:YicC/YloC family endoribonuclease n=1 Tax=Polynucleobacter sp. HIN8 TaxID=3047867 RepID=UPI0025748C1F|nr:YicC/YloC family endoribonuclease [Polynucleobacter sp. HIN8]MBU6323020.1 YicC family protein [Burkholderiales bacterium]
MISSMTGYGSASHPITIGQGSFANLQVEIRAVNSRFLDLSFRIPDECKSAEGALRELLNKHLKRGKVEVRAAWRQSSSEHGHSQSAIAIDLAKLRALKDAQNAIREQFPSAEELRIADILRYPGVVADSDTAEDQWHGAILKAGEEALQQLLQSRQAEGQALAKVLTNALDAMQGMVTKLEPRIPEIVTLYQNKLVARIEEALGVHATQANIPFNTELLERIRQEVVLYAVRIDVAEELARLKTHIQVARTAIAEGGAVGKRLDFLIQELNREANTLGSKSVHEDCTNTALELKLLIEQMREQVQNLE